jgi:mRNA-degrading endonuclease toxin of MazEF toxin-antitoxin module
MARRKGRGRLSAIDLLPREADPHVAWAIAELEAAKRTQKDILAEFNERLAALDPPHGPISPSAFNRTSLAIAQHTAELAQTREIASAVAATLDGAAGDDVTVLLIETIKSLTLKMLRNAGELTADKATADMLAASARALKNAQESRSISAADRERSEKSFKAKAVEAVDKVARIKGLTEETVDAIKDRILGVRS